MIKATTDSNSNPGYRQVAGVAGAKTSDNPTGQDIRVTIRSDRFGPGLDQIVGHEGSHVADGSEWVASGFAKSKAPTLYQTESDAYTVQSLMIQADFDNKGTAAQRLGEYYKEPGKNPWLPLTMTWWDSGWKEADRATIRANNINKFLERPNGAGGYGVTPANQGESPFKKGSRF